MNESGARVAAGQSGRLAKTIAVLGANFGGNVGDLFLFHSVVQFLVDETDCDILVYPYPLRYDVSFALPAVLPFRSRVSIHEPLFALYRSLDHLMRGRRQLKRFVAKSYFRKWGHWFRSRSARETSPPVDAVVVMGGEQDVPFSFLDVHAYLRAWNVGADQLVYGPISVFPPDAYVAFLRDRFSEVARFLVRDPLSGEALEKCGIRNFEIVPDAAFLAFRGNDLPRSSNTKRMGLCMHSRWVAAPEATGLVRSLAREAGRSGYKLVLFQTNVREDSALIRRLLQDIPDVEYCLPVNLMEFLQVLNSVDIVISDRLHALLVGMISGTTILPIVTREKIRGYCRYLGVETAIHPQDGVDRSAEQLRVAIRAIESERQRLCLECGQLSSKTRDAFRARLVAAGVSRT
jgi:hypothetical protein